MPPLRCVADYGSSGGETAAERPGGDVGRHQLQHHGKEGGGPKSQQVLEVISGGADTHQERRRCAEGLL